MKWLNSKIDMSTITWRRILVVLFGCALCFVAGCATSPYGQLVDKNYSLKIISLRNHTGLKYHDCPATRLGWRKNSLADLIRSADACEKFHRVGRLEEIGNVLARRFSMKPWGAFYLSLVAMDRKQYPRALWMIELAGKKAPHIGLLTYQRARVLLAMGRLASANRAFHESVNESPKLVDARLYLAEINVRDQNYDGAIDQLEDVVGNEPQNDAAWANIGEAYIMLHKNSDAMSAYQHAVGINPENLQYQLRLAHLYEQSNDEKAALVTYEKVQELAENTRIPANEIDVNLNQKISELRKMTAATAEPRKNRSKK